MLLEKFLIKVTSIPYIYNSNEFQTFIRGPADFIKISKDFKGSSYEQIAEKYQQIFGDCSHKEDPEDVNNQLEDSLRFFKLSLENLEKFEHTCKSIVINYENYAKGTSHLLYSVKDINTLYTQKYNCREINLTVREECTNPYQILLDWNEVEMLDLKSIILALSKKMELVKTRVRATEKVEEEKRNLLKAQSGKKS